MLSLFRFTVYLLLASAVIPAEPTYAAGARNRNPGCSSPVNRFRDNLHHAYGYSGVRSSSICPQGATFAELPILREAGESDISSMCERIQRAVIPVIETLEGRVLLSASIQGTTLMVEGNATAPNKINVSYIRRTHSIRVLENRVRQDFPVAGLTAIQIDGGASKDIIAIAAGVTLPTTINGMGGNDQITGGAENDTIVTGQGSSVIYPGLGVNSIDLTLGSNRAILARKAVDTIIATKQDKIVGATKTTQIEAPITPAGAPVPIPPAPPLPPAPASPPELIPGTGFTGPTPQPAQIGTGYGSTENAIARWDVVPNQTFSGSFDVGVVAFDINAIDHVAFSVNGGDWSNVSQMTLDPQTNVVEYTAQLNANDFATDGQVEVRAIAVPTVGVPRVLDSLFLNSNKNGTLDERFVYVSPTGNDATADGTQAHPYQTLLGAATYNTGGSGVATPADDVTIYLEAGDYAWPSAVFSENPVNSKGWLTVTAAPGVDPATTRITSVPSGSSGFSTALVHLKNLTVLDGTNGIELTGNPSITNSIWMDDVNWGGPGPANNPTANLMLNGFTNDYWTDCYIHDTSSWMAGANLVRGCSINNVVVAYHNTGLLVNSTASNVAIPPGTQDHSDIMQDIMTTPGWGNVIIYGLTAKEGTLEAQGITLAPAWFKDVAIVNCDVEVNGSATAFSAQSNGGTSENLLIKDSTFAGPISGWLDNNGNGTGTPFSAQDIMIQGCTFPSNVDLQWPGVTIE